MRGKSRLRVVAISSLMQLFKTGGQLDALTQTGLNRGSRAR